MRIEVIRCYHDDERAEHFEVQKTLKLMQRNYYWPSLVELKKLAKKLTLNNDEFNQSDDDAGFKEIRAKIEKYIEHCVICRKNKTLRHKFYGQLFNLFISKYKWSNIILDFVIELSSSINGNDSIYDFILVVVDRLTKMAHYVPVIKKIIAPNLFEIFNRKVFKLHDLLIIMISDRDSLITSKFGKELFKFFKFDRKLSTAYHSQSNEQTERQNSTMEQYFRAYINFQQNDWVKGLFKAELAYNDSKNSITKMTFFFAMISYHPKIFYEINDAKSKNSKTKNIVRKHEEILMFLKQQIKIAQKKQAFFFNRHAIEKKYNIGQGVYLNARNLKTNRSCKKLNYKFISPYQILERYEKNAYRLNLSSNFKFHDVFHVSLLKQNFNDEIKNNETFIETSIKEQSITEYVIKNIVNNKIFDKNELSEKFTAGLYYLVLGLNCDESERTWEP